MRPFVTVNVWEDSGLYLFARGIAPDGAAFVQADIDSIHLKVFAIDDPDAIVFDADITVSSVVFNTLQTDDPRWTTDDIGYNFRYETTAAQLPRGGTKYVFEFKFTPAAGPPFHAVFHVPSMGLYGS